ncbi:hypothetical protein FXF51_05735 [Nonomuraea sp. PA05]|uniref:hypothetical protein n=1 Tax=Nonomuraea sp. PA05 TaxID=2604466 RepID=UPI0011D30CB8|nr:hypothetical protein [Nonomuraea sp. PA05]TYB69661.1 hypothetical protein FXF51_05735 [Nonomuraea sp. PA05]
MSTETPETPATTNPYQAKREAVARAVTAWQRQAAEVDEAGDREPTAMEDADDLEDCLNDEGMILLPRSTGHGKWRVLVDGQPAPYPGQDAPSHPMGAEEAMEAFAVATAADYHGEKQIVVRPATEREMVTSAVIGDATVHEDPVRIAPTVFMVETEENVGATLVRMIDKDGREVLVGLDDNTRRVLTSLLNRADGAA